MDLRSFVFGIMAGIVMLIACFQAVSSIAHVKWQPIVQVGH